MLPSIRQFGKYLALGIFLWTTGILLGGDYLHHAVHHCEEHEEEEDCSWQWLLLESIATTRHHFYSDAPKITSLQFWRDVELIGLSTACTYSSRAPPHII